MKLSSAKKSSLRFLLLLCCLSFSACVSVNIKPKSATKSKSYQFQEPQKPFTKIASGLTDHAWQNQDSGNTIAVMSECSEDRDPSLSTLEGETFQALGNYQVLNSKDLTYQDRGARRSSVEGSVDGVAVKMDVLVFKKNSCSYTLTYMGRATGFAKDEPAFDQFLRGFGVP